MNKEKLYKESETFPIYRNYGVLGAEKRNVYTYAGSHPQGVCSDEMEVRLPENNCFQLYKTISGGLVVESAWGWNYDIDDVLEGDKKPCFYALDKGGNGHRVYLDVL